jgi:hypothetical protein
MGALGGLLGGMGGGGNAGGMAGMGGGGGMGGGLGGLLGGAIGGKILGHVLGGRQPAVEQGIGRQTGMQPAQVGQLLMILAPIVMGVLAKRKQQEGIGAQQLPAVLQQDHQQVVQRDQQQGGALGGLMSHVFGPRGGGILG